MRYTNYFSQPWQGAPGVPQNGDDLSFSEHTALGSDPDPMVNDLAGLVVNSLTFGGDSSFFGDIEWTLSGNAITISNAVLPARSQVMYGIRVGNWSNTDLKVHLNCDLVLVRNTTILVGGCRPGCEIPISCCPDPDVTESLFLNGETHLNGIDLAVHGRSVIWSSDPARSRIQMGRISGTGNVSVMLEAECSLRFKSASGNSFQGRLTISGAPGSQTVFDVSGGVAVTDSLLINSLGVVELAAPNQIGDNATVAITGGAKLQMHGFHDNIGHLALTNSFGDTLPSTLDTGSATLTLNGHLTARNQNAPVTPIIQGRLHLPAGPHTFHTSGNQYAGVDLLAELTGTGDITKSGDNALLLQGNNAAFSGSFAIASGVLDVRHNNALGDALGGTVILGGSLRLQNVTIVSEPLTAAGQGIEGELPGSILTCVGVNTWHGPILLNTNLNVTGDIIFTGPISGAGGVGCFGGGTIQFGGQLANTYTGPTLVRCPLVYFSKPSGVKAFSGPLVVGGGAGGPFEARWINSYQNVGANLTLFANGIVNLNNRNEDFGFVTFNGGTVNTGTGQFAIYQPLTVNPNNSTAIINGWLGLPPGPVLFDVGDGAANPDLLVNAVVFGSGSPVRKRGPGTLHFNNANTYTGVTLVEAGTLQVNTPAGFGSGAMNITVHSNATLRLGPGGTLAKPVFISGSGAADAGGALTIGPASAWTLTGGLTLNHPATVLVENTGSFNVNGIISGTGPLTLTGGGWFTFSGASAQQLRGRHRPPRRLAGPQQNQQWRAGRAGESRAGTGARQRGGGPALVSKSLHRRPRRHRQRPRPLQPQQPQPGHHPLDIERRRRRGNGHRPVEFHLRRQCSGRFIIRPRIAGWLLNFRPDSIAAQSHAAVRGGTLRSHGGV